MPKTCFGRTAVSPKWRQKETTRNTRYRLADREGKFVNVNARPSDAWSPLRSAGACTGKNARAQLKRPNEPVDERLTAAIAGRERHGTGTSSHADFGTRPNPKRLPRRTRADSTGRTTQEPARPHPPKPYRT